MENKFRLPFAYNKGTLPEKNSNLLQIIIFIGSGILSFSAIATVLKALLDNRKRRFRSVSKEITPRVA